MSEKLTTEEFITKAREKHGDLYGYDDVEYVNNYTKVKIYCKKCENFFEQKPNDHISGRKGKGCGCPICFGTKKLTIEEFITKAREKHGDDHDYSVVEYINCDTKVKIKCKKHGVFEQTPYDHINGNKGKGCGCPVCGNDNKKLTKEEFVEKAIDKHGNLYKYDDVIYINSYTKIKIWCDRCNDYFEQTPKNHINGGRKRKGHGCPVCNDTTFTNKKIIDSLTIEEKPIEICNIIQCKCTFCKEYFTPTRRQLKNRISSLSGKQQGECRLYCSDTCKDLCPIYGKSKHYDDSFRPDTTRPVQPELRRLVLERDNNQCQICGSSKDLHCHHITGVEINPVESADIDNCITLCYTCHSRAHSSGQCDVRRKPCKI